MTDTELLKQCIQESGLKKGKLAELLGISKQALSAKLQGRREFKASEIQTLCQVLGIHDAGMKDKIFFNVKGEFNSTGGTRWRSDFIQPPRS